MKNHDQIIKHIALLLSDVLIIIENMKIGLSKDDLENHRKILHDYASKIEEV